jgi:hypothetical protein
MLPRNVTLAVVVTFSAVVVAFSACGNADLQQRQSEVAEAGRAVMPFDLEATTHVFEKRADGGLQTVVADVDDPEQIQLIRSHLAEEAERFARGDFHDPATIHGPDMPGLHELATRYREIDITYSDVERGAQITYVSADSEVVAAIHQWFDAQVRDHGSHAQSHR